MAEVVIQEVRQLVRERHMAGCLRHQDTVIHSMAGLQMQLPGST